MGGGRLHSECTKVLCGRVVFFCMASNCVKDARKPSKVQKAVCAMFLNERETKPLLMCEKRISHFMQKAHAGKTEHLPRQSYRFLHPAHFGQTRRMLCCTKGKLRRKIRVKRKGHVKSSPSSYTAYIPLRREKKSWA